MNIASIGLLELPSRKLSTQEMTTSTPTRTMFEQGKAALECKEYSKALDIFKTLEAERHPDIDSSEVAYLVGSSLYHLRNFKEALPYMKNRFETLDKASHEQQKEHSLLQVCVRYSQCQIRVGDFSGAERFLENSAEILKQFPSDYYSGLRFDFHIVQGRACLSLGRGSEALRRVKLAENEIPNMGSDERKKRAKALIYYERGVTHLQMRHPRRATYYVSRVNSEFLNFRVKTHFAASWIVAEGFKDNYVKILVIYEKYKDIALNSEVAVRVLFEVGRAHYHLGNVNKAKQFLDKALGENPKDEILVQNIKDYFKGLSNTRQKYPERFSQLPKPDKPSSK